MRIHDVSRFGSLCRMIFYRTISRILSKKLRSEVNYDFFARA